MTAREMVNYESRASAYIQYISNFLQRIALALHHDTVYVYFCQFHTSSSGWSDVRLKEKVLLSLSK